MTMTRRQSSSAVLVLAALMCRCGAAAAFLYNPQAHPSLESLSSTFDTEQIFKMRLDLGGLENHNDDPRRPASTIQPRVALNGPTIQLLGEDKKADVTPFASSSSSKSSRRIHLPGEQYARVSTGSHEAKVLETASFIGMNGLEHVPMELGCWEMIWVDEEYAGKLTCAFDLPFPIHRNGATFDKGPLYVSFPIYSPESLAAAQAHKHATLVKSNLYLHEKDVELHKCKTSHNVLAKAVHYQRAFAAFDKLILLPTVSHIPEDDDVLHLSNGLRLVKEGIVWKKLNALIGPSSHQVGKAVVSLVEPPPSTNDAADARTSSLRP